jgi:hypothetical protein
MDIGSNRGSNNKPSSVHDKTLKQMHDDYVKFNQLRLRSTQDTYLINPNTEVRGGLLLYN